MSRSRTQLWLRSSLFWIVFSVSIIVFSSLLLFTIPFSVRVRWSLIQNWVTLNLWWLKLTCNLTYEVQGSENIPPGPAIILSKHQSTWETIALQRIFPQQVWVAKRELLWIPFFGWGLALLHCIAINRGSGRAAVKQLVAQGKKRLDEGYWIVIFPEGTRVAPGKKGEYRIGGAILAEQTGYPIVPVAHNAGEFWPKRSFIKHPGIIRVRVGSPIMSSGKTAQELLQASSEWIESSMLEITTLGQNNVESNH